MNKSLIAKVVSWFLLIAGIASLVYFAALSVYLGPGASFVIFWAALGALCLGLYALVRWLGRKHARAQKRVAVVLAALIAMALVVIVGVESVIIAGGLTAPAADADYILVLGARVKETGPSVLLNYRIEKAYEYLTRNEQTRAILCGGQGSDEPMSEAQAMYDALLDRGIAPERLIMEDQSTDTEENIRFAMAYMEDEQDSVVVTTTRYHMYRALQTAREAGLENVSGNGARCAYGTLPNYYAREFFAVVRNWIFA